MLKWLLRRRLDAFGKQFGYDASYVREILDADLGAFLKFSKAQGFGNYHKNIPVAPLAAAKLVAVMAEDCGPCAQLGVTMAERAGVPPQVLRAILEGDESAMPPDVALAYRFARATLAHDPEADGLREEILRLWGEKGLISLAFGIAGTRIYPTVKYALGHGTACTRIKVAGSAVAVARPQVA
jgi:hypothetical protein